MNNMANISDISEALLAASLPIDPDSMEGAAKLVVSYYENAPEDIRIPTGEISDRFNEMWRFWLENSARPSKELKEVVRAAVSVDHEMKELANNYFKLEGEARGEAVHGEKPRNCLNRLRSAHSHPRCGAAPWPRQDQSHSQRPRCNF